MYIINIYYNNNMYIINTHICILLILISYKELAYAIVGIG